MTRRELAGPAEKDVESQSRDPDVSDGYSQPSSTLPSYEDAMGDAAASEGLSSKDGKKVSPIMHKLSYNLRTMFLIPGQQAGIDHMPPPAFRADTDLDWQDEEQSTVTNRDEDKTGFSSQKPRPKGWKARWRSHLLFTLFIMVFYNTVVRFALSHLRLLDHTPPSSSPGSNDSSWPPAREIRVHQTFGAIHGTYPLYDLLDISTLTGAIHVIIEPKPGNKTAVVNIRSKTGAIHVDFAKPARLLEGFESEIEANNEKSALNRVYHTHIETTTGMIHGDLLHGGPGGATIVTTNTGMLHLRVTPLSDQLSRLETSTKTGLSKIIIESSLRGHTLKNLTAIHKSVTSGLLDVRYPREWEGKVHAWSEGTGMVDVKGEGLNYQGGGNDVYAWRGEGALESGKVVQVVSVGTGMVIFKADGE